MKSWQHRETALQGYRDMWKDWAEVEEKLEFSLTGK